MSSAHSLFRIVLPVLAGTVLAFTSIAATERTVGRCPDLGPIHVVSFKGQESKIFESVLAIGRESTKRPFDASEVLRTFAECLDSLKSGDRERDSAALSAIGRIQVSVNEDSTSASVQVATGPKLALQLSGSGERLAKTLVHRSLRALRVRGAERTAVENALWFLWVESYVRSLGNRYNTYRYADELPEDAALRQGRGYSVGFRPVLRDGRMYADEVFDDALCTSGLASGAEIVALDGRSIAALSPAELSRYWFSSRPFRYQIAGRSDGKPFQLVAQTVPRRYRTIAWTTHGDLAYIRISHFAVESVIELRRALRAIEKSGMHGLVVDVRSNPGGVASPGIVDCFLKPGQTTMSYRETGSEKEVDVDATVEYHGIPLAVLVDEKTASMAESFAAAIQVHKRGLILGTRTFGKGVGQTIHDVLDEGTLHLVERTYFYPGTRESWDGRGLTPDIVVEISTEQADRIRALLESDVPRIEDPAAIDPVLEKAFEQLGAHP